jgi:hypothetical protein
MSAAPHVAAFCRDVAKNGKVWTIQLPDGSYIKWENDDGSEIFPLWSSKSRVEKVIDYEKHFEGAVPTSFPYDTFLTEWVPKLRGESIGLGPNWAGENLMGWEMGVDEVVDRVQREIDVRADAT